MGGVCLISASECLSLGLYRASLTDANVLALMADVSVKWICHETATIDSIEAETISIHEEGQPAGAALLGCKSRCHHGGLSGRTGPITRQAILLGRDIDGPPRPITTDALKS